MLSLVSYQTVKFIKKNPKRITKADKILNFLFLKKIIARLNKKIIFALMYFVMKII